MNSTLCLSLVKSGCPLKKAENVTFFKVEISTMKSVLITGCNRGLGLALVKHFLNLPTPPENIFTTCRNLASADKLKELAAANKNIHIFEIDVINFDDYPELVKKVEDIVGDNGLNLLINNAGISSKFTRVGLVKVSQMTETYLVNTVAPLMLAKAYLPLLKKASEKNKDMPMGISRAAVINMSSLLGSIEKNTDGGFYPYRCSKAALNAVTKSLSIDLKSDNILVASIHPGWVKTDMGGQNAHLEVDDAVQQIVKTLGNLKEEHNGGFIQFDGTRLPW